MNALSHEGPSRSSWGVDPSPTWPVELTDPIPDPYPSRAGPKTDVACVANATVVIESCGVQRDCLIRCLLESRLLGPILTFAGVADCVADGLHAVRAPLILLCSGSRDGDVAGRDWTALRGVADGSSLLVLLTEDERLRSVRAALSAGVRGYIPTSLPLSVAIEAMHLVRAGGTFIPASCLTAFGSGEDGAAPAARPTLTTLFTNRQLAVLDAVRRGKSNKVIAYDLNMAESTVKVHVRNVMRRLKARNRTEVAFLAAKIEAA